MHPPCRGDEAAMRAFSGILLWILLGALGIAGAAEVDLKQGFAEPPPGYGMVPFYWWSGEPLSVERIARQLDQLKDKGFTGVQINFAPCFQTPSEPLAFTEAWWKIVQAVVQECKKRGMTLGMDDYGFHGQFWNLGKHPELKGWHLGSQAGIAEGGKALMLQAPGGSKVLCVRAYRLTEGRVDAASARDLSESLKGNALSWQAPEGAWRVVLVFARPEGVDMSNPKAGQVWVESFFKAFEDHSPGEMGKTLSYFFQDEFYYPGMPFWSARVPEEFRKRKGYDLVPELAALFDDIGPRTLKVRLDYYDVVTSLIEEGYFRPVFEWLNQRGVIYGHDNLRGSLTQAVESYGDYFRAERWFHAPGSDRMPSLIIGKTCASIAQLYGRPRAWLEAYYGTGWGVSPQNLFEWDNQSLMDGYTLLSYHSLYYTTRGGWWAWAPGDPHFRQPYWSLMDGHYAYLRRLCFALSQGSHRCDVAILLPSSAIQAGVNGQVAEHNAHDVATKLFNPGIDFDFIDDDSVARAQIEDRQLTVSGGAYRVLVLPSVAAIRYPTLEKALAFHRAGGVVIATGCLPEASDRVGANDPQLDAAVTEIFGNTQKAFGEGIEKYVRESTGFSRKASWVWTREPQGQRSIENQHFRKAFTLPGEAAKGQLRVTCDNIYTAFLNGQRLGGDAEWESVDEFDVTRALRSGPNVLAVEGRTTDPGAAALAAEMTVTLKDGKQITVATDETWRYASQAPANWQDAAFDDSKWSPVVRQAEIGAGVWAQKMKLVGAKTAVTPPIAQKRSAAGGIGAFFGAYEDAALRKLIDDSIPRDFIPEQPVHVLHRRIGQRDLYAVCNPGAKPLQTTAFFRAKGTPTLWDPWTGKTAPALEYQQDERGTKMPLALNDFEMKLVVFEPGAPTGAAVTAHNLDGIADVTATDKGITLTGYTRTAGKKNATVLKDGQTLALVGEAAAPPAPLVLDGLWDFELKPTMDNRDGDFRSPPSEGMIGAEAKRFRYAGEAPGEPTPAWQAPDFDDSKWPEVTWSFGPRFLVLGPIPPGTDTSQVEAALLRGGQVNPGIPVQVAGRNLAWRAIFASLRWGIERDPLLTTGHGGYGTDASVWGLKGIVPDALLDLTSGQVGSVWFVWTSLRASAPVDSRLAIGCPAAYRAWVNGTQVLEQVQPSPSPGAYYLRGRTAPVQLRAGTNPLLLRIVEPQVGPRVQLRAFVAVDRDARDENAGELDERKVPSGLLARRLYARSRDAVLDANPEREKPVGWYRFRTPPGLKAMKIVAHGKVRAWVDGQELAVKPLPDAPSVARQVEGAEVFQAVADRPFPKSAIAALRIEHRPGYYDGAALPEPVEFECAAGQAPLGQWSEIGLATYSGQAWYRRTVTLSPQQTDGKVLLHLGKVSAAARVIINGEVAGTCIAPPWTVDITRQVKPGENRIEILIANTLGNYFSVGIPDNFVFPGQTSAGLLGPVRIETLRSVRLLPARGD